MKVVDESLRLALDGSTSPNKSSDLARLKKYAPYDLTGQQLAFVMEYVLDPSNQTEAAIRAGYAPRSAYDQAHNLLKHDGVKAAVQDLQAKLRDNTEVTAERIIQRLADIAFDPRPKPRSADQVKALELLSKWLGLDTADAVGRVEVAVTFADDVGPYVDLDDAEWEDADDG